MAALICDLCGGKLSMGAGGIAVCESCGMEHTQARMHEKVQEIKGVVRVDNSHLIENYLTMAENAFKADNNKEAESYCNKIIEIEPAVYRAWLLKGKAAGWESTTQENRISEAVSCFAKSIEYAPVEEKESIMEQCLQELKSLSVALVTLRANRFVKYTDTKDCIGVYDDFKDIMRASSFLRESDKLDKDLLDELGDIIEVSAEQAFNNTINKFRKDRITIDEAEKLMSVIDNCNGLLDFIIKLCDKDEKKTINRYQFLIYIINTVKYIMAGDYFQGTWRSIPIYNGQKQVQFKEKVKNYELIIVGLQHKAKERLNKEYWQNHADEKEALEKEREMLNSQIFSLKTEIDNIPGVKEKSGLNKKITELNNEKASLGILKIKEKKTIQDEIDIAKNEIQAITDSTASLIQEIENRLKPIENRFLEIELELTKDRSL